MLEPAWLWQNPFSLKERGQEEQRNPALKPPRAGAALLIVEENLRSPAWREECGGHRLGLGGAGRGEAPWQLLDILQPGAAAVTERWRWLSPGISLCLHGLAVCQHFAFLFFFFPRNSHEKEMMDSNCSSRQTLLQELKALGVFRSELAFIHAYCFGKEATQQALSTSIPLWFQN